MVMYREVCLSRGVQLYYGIAQCNVSQGTRVCEKCAYTTGVLNRSAVYIIYARIKFKRNAPSRRAACKGLYMFTCLCCVHRDLRLIIEKCCDPRLNGVGVRLPIG